MSRVSVAIRKIRWGSIITILVRMAETALGGGTGALKKQLVMAAVSAIGKQLASSGKVAVPENLNYLADELVEQSVELLKANGELGGNTPATEVATPPLVPALNTTTRKRGGRKPGSRNKPKSQHAAPLNPPTLDDADAVDYDIDEVEE